MSGACHILLLQHGFWEGGGAAVISLSGGGWG